MNYKRYFRYLAIVVLVTASAIASATDLRGRIEGFNQYSRFPYPIGGAMVDLYVQTRPGIWQPAGRYITGPDGMYYFRNIYPGYYSLQVNGRQNYPVDVYNQRFQDLPPIILNY